MLYDVPYKLVKCRDLERLWIALHDLANNPDAEPTLLSLFNDDWAVTVTNQKPKTLQLLKLEQDVPAVNGVHPVHGLRKYAYHAFASWPHIERQGYQGLRALEQLPRNAANTGVTVHTHDANREHIPCPLCKTPNTTPEQYAAFNRIKELLELVAAEKTRQRKLQAKCNTVLQQLSDNPDVGTHLPAMRAALRAILDWGKKGRGPKRRLNPDFESSIERALAM